MKRSIALAFLFPSLLAAQATIRVPADVPTIQGGIELARDGDTVLVAAGTYTELVDYLGKAITVTSEGGAAATTIDGTGLFGSVVSFHSSEGPGSVLRGFTITGGNSSTWAGGISATRGSASNTTSPRIEACVVRGNSSMSIFAGGASGNMTMLDCRIEGNIAPYGVAGGVTGSPRLVRCTVSNNTGYDGGGIALGGGRAKDCVITGNASVEGTRGGGVYLTSSDAVLEGCLVAGNLAAARGQYAVMSAGVYVSPVAPGARIIGCTIVDNIVSSLSWPPSESCGGVQGPAVLVNTIVRGNDEQQIGTQATVQAFFSDIEGGHPGPGNFDLDPLFVDPASGDYHLQAGSPCIDAGAPQSPPDPDGTRADVGAFPFLQRARVVERNGTGVNPFLLTSVTLPVIGSDWHARVDSSFLTGAGLSVITIRTLALDPGLLLPQGELLVDGHELHRALAPSSGGLDDLFVPIPNLTTLIGRVVYAQGILLAGRRARLGNGLDLFLGF